MPKIELKEQVEQLESAEQADLKTDEVKINDNVFDVQDFINLKNYFNVLPQELLKRVREKQERQKAVLEEQDKDKKLDEYEYKIIEEDEQKDLSPQERLKEMLEGDFKIVDDELDKITNVVNIKCNIPQKEQEKQTSQTQQDEEYVIEDDDNKNCWVVVDTFEWKGDQYKIYEEITKPKIIKYNYLPGTSQEEKKINQFVSKLIRAAEKAFNKQCNIPGKANSDDSKAKEEKQTAIEKRKEKSKKRMHKLREELKKDENNLERK